MNIAFLLLLLNGLQYLLVTITLSFSGAKKPYLNMFIVQAVPNIRWLVRRYYRQKPSCELCSKDSCTHTAQSNMWDTWSVGLVLPRCLCFRVFCDSVLCINSAAILKHQKKYNIFFLCFFYSCTACWLVLWLLESKSSIILHSWERQETKKHQKED